MEFIPTKSIIIKNKDSEYFGSDYNMNIYKGCCHGCIYCDSRSSCYRVDHFDTVRAKENALEVIRNDLRRKVKKGVIGTGAMSDPYNPCESEYKLTRNALELINAYGFGVSIATKSNLVSRDIDILSDIKQHSPVLVKITITTIDDALCKIIEPNVSLSSERFEAIRQLADSGIFAGVLLTPILPYINDTEENIIGLVKKAYEYGAKFVYPSFGVTLRDNQREWFYDKLDIYFPGLRQKYISRFRNSYVCNSPKSKKLWAVFDEACHRYGLIYDMKKIIHSYKGGYDNSQLSLF